MDGEHPAALPPPGLTPARFRELAHAAAEIAACYLAEIAGRPVFTPMTPAERLALLEAPLPEHGRSPEELLAFVRDRILARPMGNGHPRFFGWVNSAPAPIGVLGDLLAAATNPSVAGGDHAAVYLERAAVREVMELVGFPTDGSGGLLVSGGSMANLTGLAAARHAVARRDGWDIREEGLQGHRPRLVLYVSEEGHSCLRKAAELLGLGAASVRTVPVDGCFRLDVAALGKAIAADRAGGRRPFCVAASAGTVNTGAVDPLVEIADLCAAEDLWLHVDGAYGAVGVLNPELASSYQGLARADSLALDPHKWLAVPVECGCALVRDGAGLRDAFSLVPPYLRTEEGKGFGGLPWFSEYGFQQSRGFRALKLWLTLQHLGRQGVANLVLRHCELARHLAALVEAAPDLERAAPVKLSVVCFRYVPRALGGDESRLESLNRRVVEQIQEGGRVFVTGTVLRGRFVIRACVLHYATAERDIEALVQVVREVGGRLAASAAG